MQSKVKVLNICYFLTLLIVYLTFLNKATLEFLSKGYNLFTSLMVAGTQYELVPFVLTVTALAEFTTWVVMENIEGKRKTKYKESKSMRGKKKKPKVFEIANLMTTIHVKESKRKLGIYLDDFSQTDEVTISYSTVLTYKEPDGGELIEVELTEKAVYDCVEEGKSYKAKITIEYSKRGEVIGTDIAIIGL